MDSISKILFWVANSLLIPDIIILLVLFVRSLLLLGSFYNQFITRQKNNRQWGGIINVFSSEKLETLQEALPQKDNSLYVSYLRKLLHHPPSEAYSEYLVTDFETEAEKDLGTAKLLAKIGPVLGLIGTLIAMSPALVSLSSGDISGMAYNMQIVFATTVIGLVISIIGIVTLQFKQRWYLQESNQLFYISQILIESSHHEKTKNF